MFHIIIIYYIHNRVSRKYIHIPCHTNYTQRTQIRKYLRFFEKHKLCKLLTCETVNTIYLDKVIQIGYYI